MKTYKNIKKNDRKHIKRYGNALNHMKTCTENIQKTYAVAVITKAES